MKEIVSNKYLKYGLLLLGIITTIIPIVGSFYHNGIDVDSAIILTEMERIYEGYIPYKTLHLNYPPLWFYINVLFKWMFHIPYGFYKFYLGVHWVFVVGCAVCLFFISKKINNDNIIAGFVVWLFIIMSHWLQGNEVLFEIPSVFWGMLAITLYYRWETKSATLCIIIGIISCFSFLTKQFGAGFLLLLAWLIITSVNNNKWRQLGFYCFGYVLPLVVCYLYWEFDIFQCILLNGYGTDTMAAYWGTKTTSFDKLQRMFGHFLHFNNRIAPVVYAGVLLLPLIIKQCKLRETLLCFFAIGGFLLQFWFVNGGQHYYQYLIPFAILLIPICLSLNLPKYIRYVFYLFIVITTVFSCYSTYKNRVWKIYLNPNKHRRTEQMALGNQISNLVKDGKTVFIPHGGLDYLYYTANLYPPCMQKYGYAVGPMEIKINACAEMVDNADYVIRFSKEMMHKIYPNGHDFEYYFTDSIQNIVAQYPSDTLSSDGSIIVHYMYLPKNNK